MSLGNSGLSGFKPKASLTAAKLLAPTPVKETSKKETTLQLRISTDILLLFKETCEEHKTSMSTAVRNYMQDVISIGFQPLPLERAATICTDKMSVQNVLTNSEFRANGQPMRGKLNFRNDAERKQWLDNFKDWGVWLDVPDVGKTFYRYDFINGCALIVEVGIEYYQDWQAGYAYTPHEWKHYSIINNERQTYDSHGISYSYIVQWLTKHAREI